MESPTRLSRWQVAIGGYLAVALGVLGLTDLLPAAPPQQWLEQRLRLDQQWSERNTAQDPEKQSPTDVGRAAPGECIRRDPSRQYFYLPPELLVSGPLAAPPVRKSPIGDAPSEWRREYAEELFQLAGRALDDGQASLAYQWAYEVLRFDPAHHSARRIVGLQPTARTAGIQLRAGRKRHPKLGWPAGQFLQISTPHFRITTNDDRDAALRLADTLEELQVVWQQCFFNLWSNSSALQRAWIRGSMRRNRRNLHQVVLFRDRQQYLGFLRTIEPQASLTLGYYHAPSRTSYFFSGDKSLVASWRHEATHQLLHERLSAGRRVAIEANIWIVEGVAVYMESLRSCQGYRTLGGLEADRLQYARYRALREEFYLPLPVLTTIGREALQRDPRIRQLYSQAAGLTHFLMDDQRGRYRPALLEALRAVYAGRDDPTTLAGASGQPLEQLDREYLAFLRVEDRDLQQLDPDAQPTHLSLGGTDVTDRGLQQLPSWNELVWLDLAATRVTDKGLTGLAAATQLQQLGLEGTSVGDATVQRLTHAEELQELDLSHTRISDVALDTLGQLPNLTRVWLTGTAISDRGLSALRRLQKLQTLELSHTQVTEQGRKALSDALPQLRQD